MICCVIDYYIHHRELSGNKKIKVIAIDAKDAFAMAPNMLDVFLKNDGSGVFVDYTSNSKLKPVFLQGLLTGVSSPDGTKGQVTVQKTDGSVEKVDFDYCVLTTGASYGFIKPPVTSTTTKAEEIETFAKEKAKVDAAHSVVVVGGGPIGVEVAAAIAETYENEEGDTKITLIASHDRLMERFSPKISDYVVGWLEKKGVTVVYNERIEDWGAAADANAPVDATVTTNKGTTYTGLVFKCIGGHAESSGFGTDIPLTQSGKVLVDSTLQVHEKPNIYAAGDVAATPEEKTANYADYAGWAVALNILASISGKELITFPAGIFKGQETLPMASGVMLGWKEGVMQIGSQETVGGTVASMRSFFGRLIAGSARGSWFYGWLFRSIKSMFAGQIAAEAKKAAASAGNADKA